MARRADVLVARRPLGFASPGRREHFAVVQSDELEGLESLVVVPLDDDVPMYERDPLIVRVSAREAGTSGPQVVLIYLLRSVLLDRFEPGAAGRLSPNSMGMVDSALRRTLQLLVFALTLAWSVAFPGLRTATAGPLPLTTLAPSAAASLSTPTSPSPTPGPSFLSLSQPLPASPPDVLDRQTPRRTILGFLKEGKEADFTVGSLYLDLRDLSESIQKKEGPGLAQKLAYAIAHRRRFDISRIPDDPEGDPSAKPAGRFVVDSFFVGEEPVAIAVERVHFPDGVDRWLIARSTVAQIPTIDAAYGPRPVGVPIPASLTRPQILGNEPWQWMGVALALAVAYVVARAVAALAVFLARIFAHATPTRSDDMLVESARRPLRLLLGALLFRALLAPLQLTTTVLDACEHVAFTCLVIAVAWFVIRALRVATLWLDERSMREGGDLLRGRRVRTQAVLLHRLATVTVLFLAASIVLMQFDLVRNFGYSLLASAGLASVVVGLAAQKSLAAIIGGIQFSAAQPVRMGDQVVVEGEFGEIEEINLTYAVVRIWDKRRLILPITYFLEKPFQNWTRSTSDLIGTVFLKADFGVPVDIMRKELERVLAAEPLWDKLTLSFALTDIDSSSVTLRALVSASDAGRLWDLRCSVREKLLFFLQQLEGGKHLPRNRQVVDEARVPHASRPEGAPMGTPGESS